jgi:putative ABC transport system permease protein
MGFGLRDSITGIVTSQFGDIGRYDISASLEAASASSADTPLNREASQWGQVLYLQETSIQVSSDKTPDTGMSVYLHVPEEAARLSHFLSMRNRITQQSLTLSEEGVVLSEKLAMRLNVSPGDIVYLARGTDAPVSVSVEGVMENYLLNYVYMSPAQYTRLLGAPPAYTRLLLRMHEGNENSTDDVLSELIQTPNVVGAVSTGQIAANADDMLESLNLVVWVIIAAAAILAFVVLYNLTNINITERSREIATLKVLGFYEGEVASYVYRENILLTLLGTALGLFLGVFLHRFVVATVEVDEVMFRRVILPASFLFAAVFTLLSSGLVNLVMLQKLRHIDMVESLKSAE